MELNQVIGLIKNTIVDLKDEEEMAKTRLRLAGRQEDDSRLAYLQGRREAYEVVLELLGKVESEG